MGNEDGCDKKAHEFWLSDRVINPPKPTTPSKPPKPPKAMTMADLPPACKDVLAAPARQVNQARDRRRAGSFLAHDLIRPSFARRSGLREGNRFHFSIMRYSTGSTLVYFTCSSAKLDSIEAMPSSRVSFCL